MFERDNGNKTPSMEEMHAYVRNHAFDMFLKEIFTKYQVEPRLEFSKCSFEYGWNLKYKKSGRTLCTIYPKEGFFTVLVVIGQREKASILESLETLSPEVQAIYRRTKEGIGQKWLMIDLNDCGAQYADVLRLIAVRMKK